MHPILHLLYFPALGFVLLNMGSYDAAMKTFNEVLYVSSCILIVIS